MKNDGGPAFPIPDDGTWADPQTCKVFVPYRGMSLRDWFAGQALAGMCVGLVGELRENGTSTISAYAHGPCNKVLAERAYAIADSMLKERSRE